MNHNLTVLRKLTLRLRSRLLKKSSAVQKKLGTIEYEGDWVVVDTGNVHLLAEDVFLVCRHMSLHINLKL